MSSRAAKAATLSALGVWRSLVARSVRVGEVPSSNLGTPISPLQLTVDDRGAAVLDVVESSVCRDLARLRRAKAELEPERLRARGDCLPRMLGRRVRAAKDVDEVDRVVDLGQRGDARHPKHLLAV